MGASLENSDNKETPVESASVASKEGICTNYSFVCESYCIMILLLSCQEA